MREGGQSNLDRVMAPSLRNEWAWHGADNEGNVGCSRRPALAPPESISEPNRGAIVVSCRFPRILGQPDSLDFQLLQGRTDNTAFRSRGHEHSTPAEIDRLQKAGLSPYFFDSQRQQPPPKNVTFSLPSYCQYLEIQLSFVQCLQPRRRKCPLLGRTPSTL